MQRNARYNGYTICPIRRCFPWPGAGFMIVSTRAKVIVWLARDLTPSPLSRRRGGARAWVRNDGISRRSSAYGLLPYHNAS